MSVPEINLWATWIGILLGMVSGMAMGVCFAREDWLGGYNSWTRRLIRLGHISFFGLAFVNLVFAVTVKNFLAFDPHNEVGGMIVSGIEIAGCGLIVGAVLMPAVCFMAAWKKPARMLFALPVGALLVGVVMTLLMLGLTS